MPIKMKLLTLMVTSSAIAFAQPAAAQGVPPVAPGAQQATVAAAADKTRLRLAGTVVSTTPSSFQLDIGNQVIGVEMDDWDWYKEGRALKAGDQVVVTGNVDRDVGEAKKIEAISVYVRNSGVIHYANGADEEDLSATLVIPEPAIATDGIVMAVQGREFTIGGLDGSVRVDAAKLVPAPSVKIGDRIRAWGDLAIDEKNNLELMAKGLVVFSVDRKKRV